MKPAAVTFTHRIATWEDVPAIVDLMQRAISENMRGHLSAEQIDAARESMGVDRTLIEDRTYFVIETVADGKTALAGCGGWGKRKTLFGGDHTTNRDDSLSDPSKDAARIRAMYTHPSWVRCGVGSLLLKLGEDAARKAGFSVIELGSSIPGEAFYRANGYEEIGRIRKVGSNGVEDIVIKMSKRL